jgi:hypothetical protein
MGQLILKQNLQQNLHKQRGLSLLGLIMVLIVVGFFGVLGAQIGPTFLEYRAITRVIDLAKASSSVAEIKQSFNKQADVNYITSLKADDLEISKENGEFIISFSYDKKIPLVGPASILLEYKGSTAPSKKLKE